MLAGACEEVTINLGLGISFPWLLQSPLQLTTDLWQLSRNKAEQVTKNSELYMIMAGVV